MLYSYTCIVKITSSLLPTGAGSMASKTVNTYWQSAPKGANPQSSAVCYSLPMVADKIKRKIDMCHANKPPTDTHSLTPPVQWGSELEG